MFEITTIHSIGNYDIKVVSNKRFMICPKNDGGDIVYERNENGVHDLIEDLDFFLREDEFFHRGHTEEESEDEKELLNDLLKKYI